MLIINNEQPDADFKKNVQSVQVEHKQEAPIVSDITTTVTENWNNHQTYNKETFGKSNHRLRNKTIVNLSKQILTIDKISVLELRLTFCPTVKIISKEHNANDSYRYIRRLKLHEYFYENPNKNSPENTDKTLRNSERDPLNWRKNNPYWYPQEVKTIYQRDSTPSLKKSYWNQMKAWKSTNLNF